MPAIERESSDSYESGGRRGPGHQRAPFASPSIISLTAGERAQWNGFCEIESEPTSDYACASVALLNIVNNAEGLELGEELQHFKEFTKTFTPALRGIAINNFEFVKRVHNSFARKMDILSIDLQLKNEATEKRRTSKATKGDDEQTEPGFHFIAFVPVRRELWKFDGLERQPQNLGMLPRLEQSNASY
ncbi:hypothetical protein KEM54_000825 [Ascosphaera aggregata]|nr:hypothetical protein KEM54_000825 [Ascosphaera aggregata]